MRTLPVRCVHAHKGFSGLISQSTRFKSQHLLKHWTPASLQSSGPTESQPTSPEPAGVSAATCAPHERQRSAASRGYATRSPDALFVLRREAQEFKQVDHATRRRERELREIVQAGVKAGLDEAFVRNGVASLERLLPDLQANTDKMRASDWVKLLSDVPKVAMTLITLKSAYPCADVSRIVSRTPRVLLQPLHVVHDNAIKVKQILAAVDGAGEVDAIVEAVPYLLDPRALVQSLSNLRRWFPAQDPVELLRKNPTLLLNIEEADLPADPIYGVELHDEAS